MKANHQVLTSPSSRVNLVLCISDVRAIIFLNIIININSTSISHWIKTPPNKKNNMSFDCLLNLTFVLNLKLPPLTE